MIFRTGSILIVGMCDEFVLDIVYKFIKNLLKIEFATICQRTATTEELTFVKKKNSKVRKRPVIFDQTSPTCNQTNTVIQIVNEK